MEVLVIAGVLLVGFIMLGVAYVLAWRAMFKFMQRMFPEDEDR